MRIATRLAAVIATLSLIAFTPARAQDVEVEVLMGNGLVCDTQHQAERFVALFDGNADSTASAVNVEERDPAACVVATVAYVLGPKIETVRNRTSTFNVVRILVLGVVTEAGVQQTAPAAFYSIVKVEEVDA